MDSTPSSAIRAASVHDASGIANIFNYYVRETAATFETQAWTASDWQQRCARLSELDLPFLVAEDDGQVVGFAYVGPWREKPAYRHTLETTVYLARGRRGHGWGRRLCADLYERAAATGARELVAVIADTGDPASLALHRAMGFRDVGRLVNVGYQFGRWLDVVLLQKSLGASRPPK